MDGKIKGQTSRRKISASPLMKEAMSCKLIPAAGFNVVSPVSLNHMVKVLSNKKKRDWNREINLPRFNCMRSVSICKGKHADSKDG